MTKKVYFNDTKEAWEFAENTERKVLDYGMEFGMPFIEISLTENKKAGA